MDTVEVKVDELKDFALDYAVAKAIGMTVRLRGRICEAYDPDSELRVYRTFYPHMCWKASGILFKQHGVSISYHADRHWAANVCQHNQWVGGDDPKQTGLRAIVLSLSGPTVRVPAEMVKEVE